MSTEPGTDTQLHEPTTGDSDSQRHAGWRTFLGFRNISAIYILLVVIIIFSLVVPSTFLTLNTVTQIANQNVVAGILALGLVIPLTAGVFDLSCAYTLGVVNVFVAYLLGSTSLPIPIIILAGVAVGLLVGTINGIVVVIFRIDSFIGTLATGSLLQAIILLISNDELQSAGFTKGFGDIAQLSVGKISLPVFYFLVIAFVMWYILEHRVVGRELRAVGLAPEVARLVGVRVQRIRFASLIVSGGLAAVAGIILTATVSGGSPDIGPPYLIPAFTTVFLGATQLKSGLFNVWGTVIAIILLGTVDLGLALDGAAVWVPDVVTGVVLVAALGLTVYERKS